MHTKEWDDNTNLFQTLNVCKIEVWEWISNFILHVMLCANSNNISHGRVTGCPLCRLFRSMTHIMSAAVVNFEISWSDEASEVSKQLQELSAFIVYLDNMFTATMGRRSRRH